jgi:hypothetical protein
MNENEERPVGGPGLRNKCALYVDALIVPQFNRDDIAPEHLQSA